MDGIRDGVVIIGDLRISDPLSVSFQDLMDLLIRQVPDFLKGIFSPQ